MYRFPVAHRFPLWSALSALGLVQLISIAPSLARSSSRADSRKNRENAAKIACSVGDVAKGIELLAELYVETNDLVYVHNQGRCYQQNGQAEKALPRFEEFLRKASGLSSDERATVEGYINECQSKLERISHTGDPVQPRPVETVQPQPTPVSTSARVDLVQPMQPSDNTTFSATATASRGGGLRVGGVVMAAVGLAGIGAGVAFNLLERNLHNQMATDPKENTPGNESKRSTYQTVSIVGYAGGGAILATGVILYIFGVRQGNDIEKNLSLMPALTANEVGLTLKGLF